MAIPDRVQIASRLMSVGTAEGWKLSALAGAITELSCHGASAGLTLAMRLVWEAQAEGEPVAWVSLRDRCFYPPDARDNGIDLEALAVVRLDEASAIGKACDMLVRSGGFGLVVLDLGSAGKLTERHLTRLLGLARKHGTAIVCLTDKPPALPSLGSLISLRAPAQRRRVRPGAFACELTALKDKRRVPGWRHTEVCRGPAGLR